MNSNGNGILQRVAESAMLERGLLIAPPPAVLAEVEAATAVPIDGAGVQDLRGLPWTSIDNVESQDLDQIELCEPAGDGVRLRVAIADVGHFVPLPSATDGYAGHNTTSVYTGVRTFPMLPDRLSYDRSSLLGGQARLAMVIETLVRPDGGLGEGTVYPALVQNQAKLDYPSMSAWLAGEAPPPAPLAAQPALQAQLRAQDELARRLKRARCQAGALDLDTGEALAVIDSEGQVLDLAPRHPGRASRLIEELMIASNRTVARTLDRAGLPSLRRVVREPRRWAQIVHYAGERGYHLPEEPSPLALSRFIDAMRAAHPLEQFAEISLAVVKLMGRGEYVAHQPGQPDIGHFGLATEHYTHATAPNRRYPDLITQRLLFCLIGGHGSPYALADLSALAEHCSQREADAQKVERRVRKSVAAQLLASRVGQRFSGIVTGASPKGTWARVDAPPVEGRVVADEAGLRVGDRVRLRLKSVSIERGYIDFTTG